MHRQLARHREHAPLKTEAGRCEVILAPTLAKACANAGSRAASRLRVTSCSATRSGAASTTARSAVGFRQAIKRAGLEGPGKLTLHSLRHGFASLLIANGLNVVYVSRQLGHANPSITLEVYAHLFEPADHATAARQALEASYAATVSEL